LYHNDLGWRAFAHGDLADTLLVPSQSYPTIQAAIDAAVNGDDVVVAPGTYLENISLRGKAITVRSQSGPMESTIDGSSIQDSVVVCTSGETLETVLQGFTITGGRGYWLSAFGPGGGIYIESSGLTILDCVFVRNSAGIGGAIAVDFTFSSPPPSLVVRHCVFEDNVSVFGAGAIDTRGTGAVIEDSLFLRNRSTFRNVDAPIYGGAISVGGVTVVRDCRFSRNEAYSGGALAAWGEFTGLNLLFDGNGADHVGRAAILDGSATFRNCTFFDNVATIPGTVACRDDTGVDCQLTVVNSILRNGGNEIRAGESAAVSVTFSAIEGGYAGEGNIDANPQFTAGPDGCFYLSQVAAGQTQNSPYVDAGSTDAGLFELDTKTTRSDQVTDAGRVDIGFHYAVRDLTWQPTDDDSDGVDNACDNCPTVANVDQSDRDHDFVGDECDSCPDNKENDADADGVCGDVDQCPGSDDHDDLDMDGVPAACDNCPEHFNPLQPGEVSLRDLGAFVGCMGGPNGGSVDPSCMAGDFNSDGRIDLHDVAAFQRRFGFDVGSAPCWAARIVPLVGRTAMSGSTLIVVENLYDEKEVSPIYVFRDEDGWIQEARLILSNVTWDEMYRTSAAIHGDRIIVGLPDSSPDGLHWSGSAHVLRNTGSRWTHEAILVPDDPSEQKHFGWVVAIHDQRVVIGALGDRHAGVASGAAYVYEFLEVWSQTKKLIASDAASDDLFGDEVALDASRIVVGAPVSNPRARDRAGAAYVFRFIGNDWVEEQKLTALVPLPGDRFGGSVAIDGEHIVLGAIEQSFLDYCRGPGSAYVFRHDGSAWIGLQELPIIDPVPCGSFGNTVALSANFIAVSAPGPELSAFPNGSVHLYELKNETWSPTRRFSHPQQRSIGLGRLDAEAQCPLRMIVSSGSSSTGYALYDLSIPTGQGCSTSQVCHGGNVKQECVP